MNLNIVSEGSIVKVCLIRMSFEVYDLSGLRELREYFCDVFG